MRAASGDVTWRGRVDGRTNLIIEGSKLTTDAVTGRKLGNGRADWNGELPRREVNVIIRKTDGRGSARVIQQPRRANGFTTIVAVDDRRRGSDNYQIKVSWRPSNRQEAYSKGKVVWRGRVDQTGQVTIAGEDVFSEAISGRALTNVRFDIDGYLARRRGTVSIKKLDGRGTVTILEQPSQNNDYSAVIKVFDPKGSDDYYEFEVTW